MTSDYSVNNGKIWWTLADSFQTYLKSWLSCFNESHRPLKVTGVSQTLEEPAAALMPSPTIDETSPNSCKRKCAARLSGRRRCDRSRLEALRRLTERANKRLPNWRSIVRKSNFNGTMR